MKKYLISISFIMIITFICTGCTTSKQNIIVSNNIEKEVEEVETIMFNDNKIIKDFLSKETIEWLENYNSLSKEEQLAISYIPPELVELAQYQEEDIKVEEVSDEIIVYDGKEYKKAELCNATLHWLELSDEEKLFSSYLPPEFMIFEDVLGISLVAKDVTSKGLTIECTQSGGKGMGELQTGSWYIVENWTKENGWKEMPYVIDGNIGWDSIALIVPKNDVVEWKIDWEWLYGELPSGKYRIGKEITDFKGIGNYDNFVYFAEFEII